MSVWQVVGGAFWECWAVLIESAPYLLFGFLAAGVIQGLMPAEAVAKHLGRGRLLPVVKAALFGIPLPLCSCGVLPTALGLRRMGANRGATVSFLISTPETGVDSIALTYALMDPVMALFRPLATFVTAVCAGVLENCAGDETGADPASVPRSTGRGASPRAPEASLGRRIRDGIRYAFTDLLGDLAPWLAAGFVLAGVLSAVLPDGFLGAHLGGGMFARLSMLVLGVPLYLCATASTPVAAALLLKGLSPGAALVFLLAGPATNLASLTALGGALGVAATGRYLASICVIALVMGTVLDGLYSTFGWSAHAVAGAGGGLVPPSVGIVSAFVLVALGLGTRLRSRRGSPDAPPGAT